MILYSQLGRVDVDSVLDDPRNKGTFSLRKPHLLAEGDVIVLPDAKDSKGAWHPVEAQKSNRFRAQARVRWLRLTLERDGEPLASTPYQLTIDGVRIEGTTGASGELEARIPLGASKAHLVTSGQSRTLVLGGLDPIHKLRGIQARLNNLGFHAGPEDGIPGKKSQRAIRKFQVAQKLKVDGIVGPNTRAALEAAYGE